MINVWKLLKFESTTHFWPLRLLNTYLKCINTFFSFHYRVIVNTTNATNDIRFLKRHFCPFCGKCRVISLKNISSFFVHKDVYQILQLIYTQLATEFGYSVCFFFCKLQLLPANYSSKFEGGLLSKKRTSFN